MDQTTEIIDPIILIFLFLVFSIGAIGPVIFCVCGAKRAEKERISAAGTDYDASALVEGQTDASNENLPLVDLGDAQRTSGQSPTIVRASEKGPSDQKFAVNA